MKNDRKVETMIGNILRAGVVSSAAITFIGGVIYLLTNHPAADYSVFIGSGGALRSVHGIVKGALAFDGAAIIQLGVLLLIITPVARVAFTVFIFIKERDYAYIIITLIVLAILLYGLTGGFCNG